MSTPLANVNPLSDTFEVWLEKTNQSLHTLSTVAVTTSANSAGGLTQGNATVNGIFSAQTFAVVGSIRGGDVVTPNTLVISSDASFIGSNVTSTSNVTFTNANTNLSTANLTISGGYLYVTSNVNIRSNTVHISTAGRLGVNTGNPDATLTVFGTANVAGKSTFLSDVEIVGNLLTSNNASFANITANKVTSNTITIQANSTFVDSITIGGAIYVGETSLFQNNVVFAANVSVGNNCTINNSIVAKDATFDSLILDAPLPVQSGGTGLSSFFPGVLVASNTTHIRTVDGETNDVMFYNGTSWEAELLPSMAYQNSTSVSITGGSISNISSLGVSGNVTVSGNVAVTVNINANGNITASGDIGAAGNVTCNQLLPSTDLAVDRGGTGRSSFTSGSVLIGNGSSGLNAVSPGATGNVLRSNGSTWTSVTGDSVVQAAILSDFNNIRVGGFSVGFLGTSRAHWGLYETFDATSVPIQCRRTISSTNGGITFDTINYGTWMVVGSFNIASSATNYSGSSVVLNFQIMHMVQRIA